MNNRMLKLMIFGLALLPFIVGSMELPLEGRVEYNITFYNRSGEQPLDLQVNDANGIQLLGQPVNLDQGSQSILVQLNQLPINVNISSANGVISGGTQLTQQKIRDELQKNGIIIPYNFSGKVIVTITIYQRAVSYQGGLMPTIISSREPQRILPALQPAAQIVPAAVQAPLPRGEYNVAVFGANKKPVRIQFLSFDKQTGNYSAPIQKLLENNGAIKQSFSAKDFPITFRVFEATSGNTLVYEDDLDLPALNLKDFSYTVSDTLGKFAVNYYPQIIHGQEAQALRHRIGERRASAIQPSYCPGTYQPLPAPVEPVMQAARVSQPVHAQNFKIEIRHESRKPIEIEIFTQDGTRLIERVLQANDSFILPNVSPQEFPLRLTLVDDEGKSIGPEKIRIPGFKQISIMTYDGWVFINIQSQSTN